MVCIDRSVAARLELAQGERAAQYAAAHARLQPASAGLAVEIGGGRAIFAGPRSFVNRVFALGMQGAVTPDALDALEAFYRAQQAVARLDVCPLADPSLLHLVQARAYTLQQFFNVLVCPLPSTRSSHQPSAEIEVRAIDPYERDLWLRTVAQGFSDSDTPPEDMLTVLGPNAASANGTCFLAWVEGQPAGGGALYIHEGVAECGSTSTRRQFRGRGVQSALLAHRLAVASASGCALALVVTLPDTTSQRNVERLGFQLAYTKPVLLGPAS